jgi:hypothetical protein
MMFTVLWPSMLRPPTRKPAAAVADAAATAAIDYTVILGFAIMGAFMLGPYALLFAAAKRRRWARTTLVVMLPLIVAFILLMVAVGGAADRVRFWPALWVLSGLELVTLVLLCTPPANRWYRER